MQDTVECRMCGKRVPTSECKVQNGHVFRRCRACRAQLKREQYHSDARARASQVASSIQTLVRRKFPEADTGLEHGAYVAALLAVARCHYCGLPNDGTHPFNLDHRVALGTTCFRRKNAQ